MQNNTDQLLKRQPQCKAKAKDEHTLKTMSLEITKRKEHIVMQLNYINTILKDASGLFKVGYNGLGLGVVPPCTNFDFSTKLSGGITPNPCYRIVLFFFCGLATNKF